MSQTRTSKPVELNTPGPVLKDTPKLIDRIRPNPLQSGPGAVREGGRRGGWRGGSPTLPPSPRGGPPRSQVPKSSTLSREDATMMPTKGPHSPKNPVVENTSSVSPKPAVVPKPGAASEKPSETATTTSNTSVTPPRSSTSPNPHPHPRHRRGRRLKHKEVTSNQDNPKPQSIEDAIAGLKSNPFGGPLRSPPLSSRPARTPKSPLPPPTPTAPSELPSDFPKATELIEPVTEQFSTLRVPSKEVINSRPHTPSVHIDWAGEDDGSLPDLDDWGIQTDPQVKESFSVILDNATREDSVEAGPAPEGDAVLGEGGEFAASLNAQDQSDNTPRSPDLAKGGTEDGPAIIQHPVEEGSDSIRVSLPGARSQNSSKESPVPSPTPASEPQHQHTAAHVPNHGTNTPGDSVASEWRNSVPSMTKPTPRPFSMRERPPNFERFHTRTRSLPQDARSPHSSRIHSTRPVISAVGLSRISKTLAQSALAPQSGVRERESGAIGAE